MTKYYHIDIWGSREDKYRYLNENDFTTIEWKEIFPTSPFYLFIPQNKDLLAEYNQGWKITDIMPVNSTGVKTHRDHFALDFDADVLRKRIEDFRNRNIPDDVIAQKYDIADTRDWKISKSRDSLVNNSEWETYFTYCLYRPFDWRNYYHHQDIVELPRCEVMNQMVLGHNLGLICSRQQSQADIWSLIWVDKGIIECCAISNKTKETNYLFPLYIYPNTENDQYNLFTERTSNFSPNFLIWL